MNKYDIGETVYIIYIDRIVEGTIYSIKQSEYNINDIVYKVKTNLYTLEEDIKECNIFRSVEELVQNLQLNFKKK